MQGDGRRWKAMGASPPIVWRGRVWWGIALHRLGGRGAVSAMHATTILALRKDGKVAMGGDGQVTVGDTVMKQRAVKVRSLADGKVLAGFAGAAADAFTLFEKFEEKLQRFPGNLPRAVVELAKDWRSDRVLRRLEALLAVTDAQHGFVISGSGELIEPGAPCQ